MKAVIRLLKVHCGILRILGNLGQKENLRFLKNGSLKYFVLRQIHFTGGQLRGRTWSGKLFSICDPLMARARRAYIRFFWTGERGSGYHIQN